MTAPVTITSEIQKLNPSAHIELFEIDLTPFGGDLYRFHAGTNELTQPITWDGNVYEPWAVKAEGFDFSSSGQIPRPKLSLANVYGTITALVLLYDDMVGAKVTRKRTMVKYLDAVNFTGGVNASADPTAGFPDDIFSVDRKVTENKHLVVLELTAAFDVSGVQLPRRMIVQNVCPWAYRGSECGYAGSNYFDTSDNPVGTLAADVCGKRLSSCKKRFGENNQLPFGGFPGAGLIE